ncbi:hypothetical protein B0H17DRAFT_466072 [Mycena rosella]|uniref:Uncharacterized protein n=1 Tax=Mycena rosella TaxID=1033263 RepID=A0AAD7DNH1_MYCRO|nr:hypothetical protein B0H17DRAFT_466072 [Mycena rosella]
MVLKWDRKLRVQDLVCGTGSTWRRKMVASIALLSFPMLGQSGDTATRVGRKRRASASPERRLPPNLRDTPEGTDMQLASSSGMLTELGVGDGGAPDMEVAEDSEMQPAITADVDAIELAWSIPPVSSRREMGHGHRRDLLTDSIWAESRDEREWREKQRRREVFNAHVRWARTQADREMGGYAARLHFTEAATRLRTGEMERRQRWTAEWE